MQAESLSGCDWRDPAAYAPLLEADRSLHAWEWLRREPRYRSAAEGHPGSRPAARRPRSPAEFGLVAFEPWYIAVPQARPLWRSGHHPYVLSAAANPRCTPDDLFEPAGLCQFLHAIADGEGEHLLLSDGFRAIRLDGPLGLFSGGPIGLRYAISGISAAEAPLLTLRRLLALSRTGRFSRSLHRREPRARRWILMLRAWDALSSGATQRDLAEILLASPGGLRRWRAEEPSIRTRAQRLARAARCMAAGAYHRLLL